MSRAVVDAYRHHNSYASTMKHSPRVMNPGVGGDQKPPSKLLQMRDDYQRRLIKEKEERMIHMYEDSERRNMDRIDRMTGKAAGDAARYPNSKLRPPGHMQPPPSSQQGGPSEMGSSTSVRDFFRKRREMEAKGGYIPPINHHYRQARGRTGSGNSFKKDTAGIDRAQPLAPIQARHSGVSSAPAETPFSGKPRLVKPHNNRRDDNNNDAVDDLSTPPNRTSARGGPAPNNKKLSPSPKAASGGSKHSPGEKEEKLSDFQKWQQEQTRAREERLKKLNMRAPPSGRGSGDWGQEDGGEDADDDAQQEMVDSKQRELMERIAAQQADLERLRKEREEEEEMERRETEMLRKQQADKERRRKQQEEARQKRDEEARARHEEEEEQRRAAARAQQRQRYDPSRYDDRDNGIEDPNSHAGRYVSHETTPRSNRTTPRRPPQQQQQRASRAAPPPRRDPSPDEGLAVPGPGADFYATAEDDGSGPGRLVACKLCGRKFADDRIAKHQNACKNAQKKRKAFDPVQMRTGDTDMAKYVRKGAHLKEPRSKKKADWRRQHEDFVSAIRYAKKMTVMEKEGVPLKDLPPPPPSHNPDLVPCPHCGRTFNETAAERHIPRCKELKTRPVAVKGRR